MSGRRRAARLVAGAALVLIGVLTAPLAAAAVADRSSAMPPSAGQATTTTIPDATTAMPHTTFPDVTSPLVTLPNIIPAINSGTAPKTSTDRGGWAQYAVLGGIVAALGLIGLLMWRDSRRARARGQG
jgi:hypothetical protein